MKRNTEKVINFKAKNKKIKKRHILMITIILYLLIFFVYQAFQILSLKKQEKIQARQLDELKKVKSEYQQQLEQVNSPEYIEKIARETLRMIKTGETLYVNPDIGEEDK